MVEMLSDDNDTLNERGSLKYQNLQANAFSSIDHESEYLPASDVINPFNDKSTSFKASPIEPRKSK